MKVENYFEYQDAIKLLNEWGDAYSKTGTSPASDSEYDTLFKQVVLFEKLHPELVDKNSPTIKIHTDTVDYFPKVTHKYPMLSIQNSNGFEELKEWCEKTFNKEVNEFVAEFKIDGLALELVYENDNLVSASTRGDGLIGDEVLVNVFRIKSIPKVIKGFTGIIRGECLFTLEAFNKLNEMLDSLGEKRAANPRNSASGALKLKDPDEVERRNLSFIAYSIVENGNKKHSEDLTQLKKMGFNVSKYFICNSIDNILESASKMEVLRSTLAFDTDGLVLKVNNKELYDELGVVGKYPKYYTALKFPPVQKEIDLLHVETSYSRTGAVTPVAIITPTVISGSEIERASLHNFDIMEWLGVHDGCKLVIQKAGEIIPECCQVVGIDRTKTDYELLVSKGGDINAGIKELRDNNPDKIFIKRPTTCIHCKTELINPKNLKGDSLVVLECPNSLCPIKQYKNIVRFCEKEAMNLFGISEAIIEDLLSNGFIKSICDLYSVTKEQILTMAGYKDRSAQKIIDSINKSKNNTLDQLLIGFSIANIGKTISPKIAEKVETLENFLNVSEGDLLNIPDIGEETCKSILEWISSNRKVIEFFMNNDIACKAKLKDKILSNKLEGLTLIFSGTSEILARDDFKSLVAKNKGKVASSISKSLSYFVMGEDCGPSKLDKVKEVNASLPGKIKIISPKEFLELIS